MQYFEAEQELQTPAVEELLADLRVAKARLKPVQDKVRELETQIKALVLDAGEPVETTDGKVTIRQAYEKVSYDTRALEGYAAAHPEINQFRKVTTVKAAAVIRLK